MELTGAAALVIGFLLCGGGVVAVATVGNVDWDEWLEDGNHHEDVKTSPDGYLFSVIHTDPQLNKLDHLYYSVTKLEIKDREGALVLLPGYGYEAQDVGVYGGLLIYRSNPDNPYAVPDHAFVIGAYAKDNVTYLSDSCVLEVQHIDATLRMSNDSIYSAERLFNDMTNSGAVRVVGEGKTVEEATDEGHVKGTVDWDSWLDEFHYEDVKSCPSGDLFSNVFTNPSLTSDGKYKSVTKLDIKNRNGPIVLIAGAHEDMGYEEREDGIYLYSISSPEDANLFLPGIKLNDSIAVISETNIYEIQHEGDTMEECLDSVYDAENFINWFMGNTIMAAGGSYLPMVGEVDWDAMIESGRLYEDIKTNSNGAKYSVIHANPIINYLDGKYYSVSKLEFKDATYPIVFAADAFPGVSCKVVDGGLMISESGDESSAYVFIPGITSSSGIIVLSDNNVLEVQHIDGNYETSKASILAAESMLNSLVECGAISLMDGSDPKNIAGEMDWDELRSSGLLNEDYKENGEGKQYSIVHVNPQLNISDESFYSVTKLEFRSSGFVVLVPEHFEYIGVAETNEGLYLYDKNDPDSKHVTIEGAERIDNGVFRLSSSSIVEVQHIDRTLNSALASVSAAESLFNSFTECGAITVVDSVDDIDWSKWGSHDEQDQGNQNQRQNGEG